MARRSKSGDLDSLYSELLKYLESIEPELSGGSLRERTKALVPAMFLMRDLSASLIPEESSARARILAYLKQNVGQVVEGNELMLISGISEWARRARELRTEHGWPLYTGVTLGEVLKDELEYGTGDKALYELNQSLKPDQYLLLDDKPDEEAASRWKCASTLRKKDGPVRERLLEYLRASVGQPVTGEELRYVANEATEWARRVRELRTEYGWPVVTKQTGRPDLPVGVYLLEMDRQSPVHDRKIPDLVRGEVLRRDEYSCQDCKWHIDEWNRADPRILELHHLKRHVDGGENTPDNLVTLCNLCHDQRHLGN